MVNSPDCKVMNKTYELKLKSHIGEVRRVERFVKKMAAEQGFAESRLHDIMLVITEATNNAILHGNKLDGSKLAWLRCQICGDELCVEVQDEGEGFDPTTLPNPLDEENLLKPSGRGVFLIKQLAEDVRYEFSDKGTIVRFRIRFKT
ncbi:MAG: ATP-binding protein [Candidatus Thermochlorobacter aerophilum]|jgi:serine/threonine-protein kinase RsbW|uniref:ATP-binding protein n=1 Tax=Candidatus Thermochlorobacter aerophilus TaxID=1868324 RepID=A0A395LZT2_9BACT|nr:MAG: ATP-binding protein [Candidatus Thermochlorobacter aerophilum]